MACKDYCVYKHTLPNNKVYIGITKQIPSLRWANGRGYKHSNYFYNAILKYGWLNIRHEILRDCLTILANSNNTYSSAELRKMGLFDAAGSRSYLLNPTEAKSHMLTLKRSLKDSGKITNWSTPVDENMILEYMRNPTSNKMVKNQYDLYRNKNEYIDRLNKLIPMEILMPLGGAGFVGHELNKE